MTALHILALAVLCIGCGAVAWGVIVNRQMHSIADQMIRISHRVSELRALTAQMEQRGMLIEALARDMQSTRSMATMALRSAEDIRASLPAFVPPPEMGRAAPSGETGSGPGKETTNG